VRGRARLGVNTLAILLRPVELVESLVTEYLGTLAAWTLPFSWTCGCVRLEQECRMDRSRAY